MLAASIFSASAQNVATLSAEETEYTVNAGETATIKLYIKTNFKADAFQFDINIPNGPTIDAEGSNPNITPAISTDDMNFSSRFTSGGTAATVVSYLKRNGYSIPCTDSELLIATFDVLTDGVSAGDYVFTVSDIVVTNAVNPRAKFSVRPTEEVTFTIHIVETEYNLVADDEIMPATSLLEVVDGIATLSASNVYLRADHEGGYNYSVTCGSETYCTGEALTVADNGYGTGKYNVTFTFDEEAKTIVATATFVEYATSIDNADATSVEKLVIDGQVYIRKNGVLYNALGQKY